MLMDCKYKASILVSLNKTNVASLVPFNSVLISFIYSFIGDEYVGTYNRNSLLMLLYSLWNSVK